MLRRWRASLSNKLLPEPLALFPPLLEETFPLGGGAVLGEVVVDELDLAELWRLRRRHGALVRGHLVGLGLRPQALRRRRERPVVEFLGRLEIPGALDDAHRADL